MRKLSCNEEKMYMDLRFIVPTSKRVNIRVRKAKQRGFQQFVNELDKGRVHATVSRMSRMIKTRRRRRLHQTSATKRIEPAEYTAFVATQHPRRVGERSLQRSRFQLDAGCRA